MAPLNELPSDEANAPRPACEKDGPPYQAGEYAPEVDAAASTPEKYSAQRFSTPRAIA